MAATVTAAYRPVDPLEDEHDWSKRTSDEIRPDSVLAEALRHQDEHVLRFVEVALESHRRGNRFALSAARQAITLIDLPR